MTADTGSRRSGANWITAAAAVIAAVAASIAAFFAFVTHSKTEYAASNSIKPAYQALCVAYSDFVLTQSHNGYTPEEIQRVIDFAGSHPIDPPDGDGGGPDQSGMPDRWPSISDAKACGTPAEIMAHAKR
ncbi:hypothetical protein [Mycolicibacter sinensis]|uniref:hypothetical protein n=1 Tax=Mycolicibacter sinensis (strain JDM601) TaxID=875328 RepID=UPI000A424862|nr:hypothetical protein [Mycolicibacter sinensis]